MIIRSKSFVFAVILLTIFFAGCQSAYYAAWETFGKEKRHLLKSQVEDMRSDQQEASEQFKSVLERLKEVYGFDGGELEKFYKSLSSDYEDCEDRADDVRDRIKNVEEIAEDMFAEWEKEIGEISSEKFRTESRQSLDATKDRYSRLHQSMVKAEASIEPVLKKLKDYVLYVKHNLNAQAIGSLKQEVSSIETEVESLIGEINNSIKESEDFLRKI